jgi:hypothetical protein
MSEEDGTMYFKLESSFVRTKKHYYTTLDQLLYQHLRGQAFADIPRTLIRGAMRSRIWQP